MNFIDPVLQEFMYEAGNTRKMLERVPMDKRDWKPHTKSMTLGRLASHIAEIPQWMIPILEHDELSFNMGDYKPRVFATVSELLAAFDANVVQAQKVMPGKSNEHVVQLWRLKVGGKVVFELPRIAVIRSMIINHTIHHRGQLSVYLRLNDVPLPALYGPTADEAPPL